MRAARAPDRAESSSMIRVRGRRRGAGFERAVSLDLLKGDRQQKEGSAEPAVHRERHPVGRRELRRPEQVQRHQRLGHLPLQENEGHQRSGAADDGNQDDWRGPPEDGTFDEAVDQTNQAERHQDGPAIVEAAGGCWVPGFGDMND